VGSRIDLDALETREMSRRHELKQDILAGQSAIESLWQLS